MFPQIKTSHFEYFGWKQFPVHCATILWMDHLLWMSDSRENWVFDEFLTGQEYKANQSPVLRSRDQNTPMRGQEYATLSFSVSERVCCNYWPAVNISCGYRASSIHTWSEQWTIKRKIINTPKITPIWFCTHFFLQSV